METKRGIAALRKKNKPSRRNKRPGGLPSGSAEAKKESRVNAGPNNNRGGPIINKKTEVHATNTDISGDTKASKEVQTDRKIAIYIAVLAVFLAICTMGGDNSTKDATRTNILASDTWAHYQAKKLREASYRLASDALELRLETEPDLPEVLRKQIQDKIKAHNAQADRLKSDPQKGDGQAELAAKARAIEADREIALRRDPYFDYGVAFLQIAIVLASASIVFGGGGILVLGSFIMGVSGVALMINGFLLIFSIPFVG
jgi:hypothetical protein